MARPLEQILDDQDGMSLDEGNVVAAAVLGSGQEELLRWLRDVMECDGTNNEAKLAAIVRGILLAMDQQEGRS